MEKGRNNLIMENKEVIIWHEMDGVGDSSLKFLELICQELREKEKIEFKFVQMNIKVFLERLKNIDKETEKPDMIFFGQDIVTLEQANFSEVPDKFAKYMDEEIWNSMKYKGVQRGVPYLQGNHAVFFYNKKYFKNKPETWDEIINFKKDGVCNFAMNLVEPFWLMPFIYSLYGTPIENGKVTITPENTMEVQNFILSLIKDGVCCTYSEINAMAEKFVAGDIACMLNGEWVYEYVKGEMGDDVGICLLPKIGETVLHGISSSVGIAFPGNSLNGIKKKELETFTHYMLSKDVQERWLMEHKRIPVNTEVLNEMEQLAVDENMLVIYEQMRKNQFLFNEECIEEMWDQGKEILKRIATV